MLYLNFIFYDFRGRCFDFNVGIKCFIEYIMFEGIKYSFMYDIS